MARNGGNSSSSDFVRALGLTMASAAAWGTAHLCAGRRAAGIVLLTIFSGMCGVLGLGAVLYLASARARSAFVQYAVHPAILAAVGIGLLLAGLTWTIVIVWSYRLSRPDGLPRWMELVGGLAVTVLCLVVVTPLTYAAHTTYAQRDLVNSVFPADGTDSRVVNRANPWQGKPRVNILLLGGDSGRGRIGVRTDSMTVASVDTRTGHTVLFSLPRNLENAPMPGRLRRQFPNGFQGDGPATPGILNELWQYAEDRPALMPGVPAGQRGPRMLKAVIGNVLGIPVDHYVLVNMAGFAGIIDAIGGVQVKVEKPIPYGPGKVVKPGNRRLRGIEATWYGRYRSDGSDYTRMGRQKCLLRQIAKQADPSTVITKFNQLARATKRAMVTDIPQPLLPALVELSAKVKEGAVIQSVQFVPPLVQPGAPDYPLIRTRVAAAIKQSGTTSAAASGPHHQLGIATSLDLACPS